MCIETCIRTIYISSKVVYSFNSNIIISLWIEREAAKEKILAIVFKIPETNKANINTYYIYMANTTMFVTLFSEIFHILK